MPKRLAQSRPVPAVKAAKKIVFDEDGAADTPDVESSPAPLENADENADEDDDETPEDSDDEPEVVAVQAGRKEAEEEASRAER